MNNLLGALNQAIMDTLRTPDDQKPDEVWFSPGDKSQFEMECGDCVQYLTNDPVRVGMRGCWASSIPDNTVIFLWDTPRRLEIVKLG